MGVDVDETGRDEPPVGVDLAAAGFVDRADGHDAVVVDRDVGDQGRCARAVDHGATADHQVVRHHVTLTPHVRSLLRPPRGRSLTTGVLAAQAG